MPSQKTRKHTNINIHRVSEQRLLDSRLRNLKREGSSKTFYIIMAVGLFIVGVVFGYVYYKSPVESTTAPEIIVPKQAQTSGSDKPAVSESPKSAPAVVKPKVTVLDTPIGYLNVREGPGTNFKKIGQINPGETFELVNSDAQNGWYQIKLDEARTGWVTEQYAQIK